MYRDVPKKKQACRSFVIWRYVKVYDRVTDGLESHRAFRFLDTWITIAAPLAPSLASLGRLHLHYRLLHRRRLQSLLITKSRPNRPTTCRDARSDKAYELNEPTTLRLNFTIGHHDGEDRRPREDRKAAEVDLCRPPQLHVMDRCSAHVIPS